MKSADEASSSASISCSSDVAGRASGGGARVFGNRRGARGKGAVAEEPIPVPDQVPNDQDVNDQDHEHDEREVAYQLEDLDGNEEGRLADGEPSGPKRPERHADALHEKQQT